LSGHLHESEIGHVLLWWSWRLAPYSLQMWISEVSS
jgi:hypothetical protein